jgi:hypothetical protein
MIKGRPFPETSTSITNKDTERAFNGHGMLLENHLCEARVAERASSKGVCAVCPLQIHKSDDGAR